MLKITYLESGLLLERLPLRLETWVARHSRLATRLGGTLVIQPTWACLPLSRHLPDMEAFVQSLEQAAIAVDICDRSSLEVTLYGTWITDHPASESGTFVTSLEAIWEHQLLDFWQQSQRRLLINSAHIGL